MEMLKGLLTLGAILVVGLIVMTLVASLLLPVLGLVTALIVGAVKLGLLLVVVYFIVKLISPETADRVLSKLRSTMHRAA